MSAVGNRERLQADQREESPRLARSAVLEGRNLAKRYGEGETAVDAVRDVSLTLNKGEIAILMGPSGSGKSTLLHLLAGLDRASSGSVITEYGDLGDLKEAELATWRATKVGFVLQRNNLIPTLTLAENVAAPRILAGERRSVALERARTALTEVGIGARADFFSAQVSGGEATRAAIARACLSSPGIIFADEPTGALDSANSQVVLELLASRVASSGAAALIVTHDDEVAAIGDRVLRLSDGALAGDGA